MAVAVDIKALLEAGVTLVTKRVAGTLKWRHTFIASVRTVILLT